MKQKNRLSFRARAALVVGVLGMLSGGSVRADVTVNSAYADKLAKTDLSNGGKQYDIKNQQLSGDGKNALNMFGQFSIAQNDVANLHMGGAEHQINIVGEKINIDGVVNALKNNQIGGDVYFFSQNGIAVGKTGVINVGRLTLGTDSVKAYALFRKGGSYDYFSDTALNRALRIDSDKEADISVAGTINAAEAVVVSAGGNVSVPSGAVIRTGANFEDFSKISDYRAPLVNTSGVTSATTAVVSGGGIALYAKNNETIGGTVSSAGNPLSLQAKGNLYLDAANVTSQGGKIALTVSTDVSDIQANPKNLPENGGYLSIKNSYIDSGSESGAAGNVEVTAVRSAMGITRIDVDGTTITAAGKNGNNAGNVVMHSTVSTKLRNWDIGDGAYARVFLGQDSKVSKRNTIIGDNVEIKATTSTNAVLDDTRNTYGKTEAEIKADIETTEDSGFIDAIGGLVDSFMVLGSVTVTTSDADIKIAKTDMSAVANPSTDNLHGNITIGTNATGEITTKTMSGLGAGFTAGRSTVNSRITVDDSNLYAEGETDIKAEGHNMVSLMLKDPSFLTEKIPLGVDVTFGYLKSDVSTNVGAGTNIISAGDVNIEAYTRRTFSASATSYGQFAFAVTYGNVDTDANATMAGTIYSGGDVSVTADTTLMPYSEGDAIYQPDTVSAIAANGDWAMTPVTDPISEKAMAAGTQLWTKFKNWIGMRANVNQNQNARQWLPISDKFGLNGGTALLVSDNNANATVSGKVRGLSDALTDGKYTGNDKAGANSLSVYAHALSRTSNISGSYQFEKTNKDDHGQETEKLNKNTAALAISYTSQSNHSEAALTGDVKTTNDVSVTAKTEIPWQTKYASTTPMTQLMTQAFNLMFYENTWVQPLVDSWSQAAGKGENADFSGSVVWTNYDNSAKAYIAKKDTTAAAPKVEAGGNVNVTGTTDITTVNFVGSIPTILRSGVCCFWKQDKLFNISGIDPTKAAEDGLGGSIYWLLQENETNAYIDDGADVTAKTGINVKANTEALNIGMGAAGNGAKSVAFDATLGLSRIDNTTRARVENSKVKVTNGDLSVSADDLSRHINLAGGVGVGGAKGIGASIAYNGIYRTTEAILSGDMTVWGDTDVTAKNTGSIIAFAVAGAVTYENANQNAVNAGGGNGFHVDGEENDDEDYGDFLRELFNEEGDNPLGGAENAIENMGGANGANQQEVAQQKKSWAVAANVSINNVNDTAKAYVAKQKDTTDATGAARKASMITADALRLKSNNDSLIFAGTGAMAADTTAREGRAIAMSFMYNAVTSHNESYVDGATLALTGTTKTEKKDDEEKDIDESLTIVSDNDQTITNVAGSGSGTSKGNSGAGQVSLNIINTDAKAYAKDATVKADEAVAIKAVDESEINSYTGAFSLSTDMTGTAVGASLSVNYIGADVKSYAEDTAFSGVSDGTAAGNVSLSAEEKSNLTAMTASASGTGKFAGGFSISGNSIQNTVKSYLESNQEQDVGALTVSAKNHGTATVGVGALGVAKDSAVGASMAVMVNHSTVDAHVSDNTTDSTTAWKLKELSITADNSYNGSAKKSDEDSTAKVVAIGAAGGRDLFAGSGSITINHISQTTDAYLGDGYYDILNDGDVTIQAKNQAYLFGMAGGLSLSKGIGAGVAVDVQKYTGHTYAGIKSGAGLYNPGDVTVSADSTVDLTSVAAAAGIGLQNGGAGAAGAHDITTDTRAYIGEDETDAEETTLARTGAVSVTAEDTTTLATGSGAAGVSAEGAVGAGLSAAVEVVDKTAEAFIGKNTEITGRTAKNPALTVRAENTADSTTAAAGLGATLGKVGFAGTASETFATMTTKAYMGDYTDVTLVGDTTVEAESRFTQGAGAGGIGGGANAGIGLTNSTVMLTADTQAYLGERAGVIAETAKVEAKHKTDVTYATIAGGIGGTAGVSGTAGANVFNTTTKAHIGSDAFAATTKGITLSATDETILSGGNGGVAIGGSAGGGVAMGVTKIVKDTEAYVGSGAVLSADALLSDKKTKGGNVSILAKNTEEIENYTVQGSGGASFGLAGALNVLYLNAVTKAFTGSNVDINSVEDMGNQVIVDATHQIKSLKSGVYGGAGSGGAGIGAAIDIGVIRTQTNAYLGAANTVYAGEALSVTASDHADKVWSNAIAVSVGSVGVTGSISVYNFGNTLSDADKKLVSAQADKDGKTMTPEEWLDIEMNKSDVAAALSTYDHSALNRIQEKTKTQISSTAPEAPGEKGTLASVGTASQIEAGKVTIKADDNILMENRMGNGSGSLYASVGASVSVVNADTTTKTSIGDMAYIGATDDVTITANSKHKMDNETGGASGSAVASVQGTEETWNDTSRVKTVLGELSRVSTVTGKSITIGSTNTRIFDSALVGATAAIIGALNGAVITSSIDGSAETILEDGSIVSGTYDEETDVTASPDIDIYAKADTNLKAGAVGANVGIFSGTGTGVSLSSDVTAKVDIGDNVGLEGNAVTVSADNTPLLKATANSYGVGLAGVGVTVAKTVSEDKALVNIGKQAEIYADDVLTVAAKMNKPENEEDLSGYAGATAGSGGVISGSVAVSQVDMDTKTAVEIGENSTFLAKKVNLLADHKDSEHVDMNAVGAVGVTGNGGDLRVTITSDSHVKVGDGTWISSDEETTIAATNDTYKHNKGEKNGNTIGASVANGNGIVSVTKITHNTKVDIGEDSLVTAGAAALTDEEKENGVTAYDKKAIAVDAKSNIVSKEYQGIVTASGVSAAHINNENTVTANTNVNVGKGAAFIAGDTTEASGVTEKDYSGTDAKTYDASYRGGSVGIGARNDADIFSDTFINVAFAIASYAGSSNDVTYNNNQTVTFAGSAETAKGDISVGAGRDSSGNAGTVTVKANSDILAITPIPISYRKDPLAKVVGNSVLTVTGDANLKSDRDVYLRANNGVLTLKSTGDTKTIAGHLRDAFVDDFNVGEEVKQLNAEVVMNGKAETGIHRNKNLTVGGKIGADGRWVTTVSGSGDVSYRYSESKTVESELFNRYDEIKQKLIDYGADPAAKAAYEAELEFLEEKMAEEGLGYYKTTTVTDPDTQQTKTVKQFVRMAYAGSSELADAKSIVTDSQDQLNNYVSQMNEKLTAVDAQMTALTAVKTKKETYDTAVTAVSKAEHRIAYEQRLLTQAETALDTEAKKAGVTREAYIAAHPESTKVTDYQTQLNALNNAKSAKTTAKTDKTAAGTAYTQSATSYNTTYGQTFSVNAADVTQTEIRAEKYMLDGQKEGYQSSIVDYLSNIDKMNTQIAATEKFLGTEGCTEDDHGNFLDASGNKVITVDANGNPVSESTEGAYYLLHSKVYKQITHDIEVGDISAVIGDVIFEGDNVSGSGTLVSQNDASVTITNNSPNNLTVGNIEVVSRSGQAGTDQGGGVYYNGYKLKDASQTISAQIAEKNKDKTKTVSFTTPESTKTPTVEIKNNFNPKAHTDTEGAPIYTAASTNLTGYIYNPRGGVTVTSEYGDISNTGTVYASTVKIDVKNGDYIQSYDVEKSGSITSVGGNPMDENGNLATLDETGIQANGNIFISARYLNINSTIRSGTANRNVTIPSDYKLYYMDGGTKVDVTEITDEAKAHTILVSDASGNNIDGISYDADTNRFVVNDVDIRGGHISLVGTILNTTKDTSKAKIEALDGYGNITVDNQSDKDLEIRSLSAGEGKQGKIEITDLDRSTGKILRKTTYTRTNGQIQMVTQGYENGEVSGDPTTTIFAKGENGVYTPASGSYYNYQIGQDMSTLYTYTLKDTRFDLWGALDRAPTGKEMEAQGATKTVTPAGDPRVLEGGAFVGTSNDINSSTPTTTDAYHTSSATKTTSDPQQVTFDKTEIRLWYTIWLAKRYNYKLVEQQYSTDITQYSVKADRQIGIGFTGSTDGGNIKVIGGTQNVYLAGNVTSGAGSVDLSGKNIVQQSTSSLVQTNSLALTATENVGTTDKMIRTDAATLSGTAGKNFAVDVITGAAVLGNVTAGDTAAIKVDTGDILQNAGSSVTANRVELTSGGVISGMDADGNSVSFKVATGQKEGEAYGLKANAVGNIDIENTNGDLYIDSVISEKGSVSLTTNGSFRDNNFTDYTNDSANEKLLHWAKNAVLEKADQTVSKQKNTLIAKVSSKYGEYQNLRNYVKDGTFTIDDTTKASLLKSGMTEEEIATYAAEKQKRYDALVAAGVDTWKKADVEAYIQSIENATDTYAAENLFGNASLTDDDLTGDTYLTKDEKIECLVGTAMSAKTLLISFKSGEIKEGITDTNVSLKETPHVSGTTVSLHALGKTDASGALIDHTGDIGEKKTGMTIDMTDPTKLTAAELLALSTAERGDFKMEGNIVTVTSVRPIDAETSTGVITAMADKGAIYLAGVSGYTSGSTFTAEDEIRIKTEGSLSGITVGSDTQTVLESGKGAISGVTVTGKGVLTARAKDGVELSKSDGDLIINTVYAAEGDVSVDLKGNGSLLAVSGNDDEEDGAETGTTFLNIEGENITISGANNIQGQATEGKVNTNSVGMKVTGTKAEDGTTTAGTISAQTQGTTDVTIFGESASANTKISGATTTLTNRGHISAGTYTGTESLTVYNTKDGKISGGTFIGGSETSMTETNLALTNAGTISGGTFTAEDNASVTNSGTMSGAAVTADQDISVSNSGTIENMNFTAAEDLSVSNTGTVKDTNLTATTGTMAIANSENGAMSGGEYKAKNDLTYTATGKATGTDLTVSSDSGKVTMTSDADLSVKKLSAGGTEASTVSGNGNVTVTEATVSGDLSLKAGGNLSAGTDTKKIESLAGSLTFESTGDTTITTAEAANKITAKSDGTLTADNLKTKTDDVTLESIGAMTLGTITSGTNVTGGKNVSAKSDGAMNVDSLTAKNAELSSGDTMTVLDAEIGNTLSMNAGKDIVVNRTNAVATTMTAKGSIKTTGTNATISSETATLTAGENIELTSRSPVEKLSGVDTTEEADDVTGAGNAGSIFYAKAGTTDFDTSGKGDNVLSVKDSAKISGKTVEIDTLKGGNKIDITADNLGIDDVQTNSESINISVNGQNGKQTHYAGIHTTADVPVTITDSAIEYLDFTGKDDIGITNTNLGGDSTIRTNYINFEMRKNQKNPMAEHIGYLRFKKYNIETDIDFSRIDNGLPVNGKSPARTAYSQMMESLYDNYLGWDGDEKEEEETEETPGGIRFGKVSQKETFRSVSRL